MKRNISSVIRRLIRKQEELDEKIEELNKERRELARDIIDQTLKELEDGSNDNEKS